MVGSKGKLTQRQIKAKETQKRVYDVAIEMMNKYGYENVTVDDIVKNAGVSKGTFYTYYASKDAVIIEEFNRIDDEYRKVFDSFSPEMSASEQLMAFNSTLFYYCQHVCGKDTVRVSYSNQIRGDVLDNMLDYSSHSDRHGAKILRKILEKGLSSGEFKTNIGIKELEKYLIHCSHGVIYDWCLSKEDNDLEKMGQEFMQHIIKCLQNDF